MSSNYDISTTLHSHQQENQDGTASSGVLAAALHEIFWRHTAAVAAHLRVAASNRSKAAALREAAAALRKATATSGCVHPPHIVFGPISRDHQYSSHNQNLLNTACRRESDDDVSHENCAASCSSADEDTTYNHRNDRKRERCSQTDSSPLTAKLKRFPPTPPIPRSPQASPINKNPSANRSDAGTEVLRPRSIASSSPARATSVAVLIVDDQDSVVGPQLSLDGECGDPSLPCTPPDAMPTNLRPNLQSKGKSSHRNIQNISPPTSTVPPTAKDEQKKDGIAEHNNQSDQQISVPLQMKQLVTSKKSLCNPDEDDDVDVTQCDIRSSSGVSCTPMYLKDEMESLFSTNSRSTAQLSGRTKTGNNKNGQQHTEAPTIVTEVGARSTNECESGTEARTKAADPILDDIIRRHQYQTMQQKISTGASARGGAGPGIRITGGKKKVGRQNQTNKVAAVLGGSFSCLPVSVRQKKEKTAPFASPGAYFSEPIFDGATNEGSDVSDDVNPSEKSKSISVLAASSPTIDQSMKGENCKLFPNGRPQQSDDLGVSEQCAGNVPSSHHFVTGSFSTPVSDTHIVIHRPQLTPKSYWEIDLQNSPQKL